VGTLPVKRDVDLSRPGNGPTPLARSVETCSTFVLLAATDVSARLLSRPDSADTSRIP
jgi:hypothetical protein